MLKNSYLCSVDNKDRTAHKAAKYLSQACKNFLPAQGAKIPSRNRQNEFINHKTTNFRIILTFELFPLIGKAA